MGLFAGALPLVSVLVWFFSEPAQSVLEISLFDLVLSTVLGLSIIVSAVGAWRGNKRARIAFLILVTLHYGILACNNLEIALSGLVDESRQLRAWTRMCRNIVWIGICWWYFSSKRAKPFYGGE
jgi:hypothetical protein